ncbi:unnamed protein product [Thlaspi arvense]|uniref:Pathogenesis-related homeodomain protein n=1 Tax=Thlaspi arvense TaxID=13288 RepID=A0AAU9T2X3_THLAR|nr:unnamed protein product [Thlaspi arvense]
MCEQVSVIEELGMETKGRNEQETGNACVSVERIGSTLLSSLVKKGKETSNKRKYNKRKTEEEICSKSRNKKYSRGWVRCEEKEEGKKTRKRKSKRKQKENKVEVDEALRLQRRTSREKIRPDKELERARKQILSCKLGLRDAIRQLDQLSSVGSIEENMIAPDGSIHHDHIFCAECNSREAFLDNDIILCDGTCNRAFHQKCLDPPLETESIPPGDQGWFCKFCDCKMEIIDTMNAQIGTHFPADSIWQDIFNEEASLPIGSEGTVNNEADWPSDDSEDGDYDPEMKENCGGSSSRSDSGGGCGGDNNDEESSSTSVSLASDGEALSTGSWEDHGFSNMVESCETSNEETVCGPRQRKTVDYTKLYHKDQHVEEIPEQSEKEKDSVSVSLEGKGGRRPMFRLPRDAVEKLREVFAETELPSKAVRDKLSKELNLDPEKVSKWFKNARYMALRIRKTESVKPKVPSGDSGPEAVLDKNIETNAIQDTVDETVVEKKTETNEVQYTVDETVMEKNTETNEIQDTVGETAMEKNTETNEIQGTMDEIDTEANEHQETKDEIDTEANELQETMDEIVKEANELQETMDETISLGLNDSMKQTRISPCNDNQEEIQHANVSLPTPIEDESQQYFEQEDSSLTLVTHEEERSLKAPLEDKETEHKMSEEEKVEAMLEVLCRAQNKLLDVTQRLERYRTPKGRKKLGKSSSSSCSPEEDSVVYVPTAEIKEKR